MARNYTLKNFLGTIFGIRAEFIQIENNTNIVDYTIEDGIVYLNYSAFTDKVKDFSEIHKELWDLLPKTPEIGNYEVYCRNIQNGSASKIEMIERRDNVVTLGLSGLHKVDNTPPLNKWYYSKNSHVVCFKNETYSLVIDKETQGREFLGYSVFVRRNDGDNSENKLSYFISSEALVSRFDFASFDIESPDQFILAVL